MKITYDEVLLKDLKETDKGTLLLIDKEGDKKFAIIFNVSERGVELLFANNTLPLLMNREKNKNNKFYKVKTL